MRFRHRSGVLWSLSVSTVEHPVDPATVESEVDDVFSGDRMVLVRCPFGVRWNISRHDRDVPAEEIHAAVDAWLASTSDK